MAKRLKYLKKTVKFGKKELIMWSLDGNTWSSRKEELTEIQERHENNRITFGQIKSGTTSKKKPKPVEGAEESKEAAEKSEAEAKKAETKKPEAKKPEPKKAAPKPKAKAKVKVKTKSKAKPKAKTKAKAKATPKKRASSAPKKKAKAKSKSKTRAA